MISAKENQSINLTADFTAEADTHRQTSRSQEHKQLRLITIDAFPRFRSYQIIHGGRKQRNY